MLRSLDIRYRQPLAQPLSSSHGVLDFSRRSNVSFHSLSVGVDVLLRYLPDTRSLPGTACMWNGACEMNGMRLILVEYVRVARPFWHE